MHAKQISASAIALIAVVCCAITGNAAGEFQIGPYIGTSLSSKVTAVHGDHPDLSGNFVDTRVTDVDIKQYMTLGINARYYFNNYLGLDGDAMYSFAQLPEQHLTLGGYSIYQPQANFNFYTLSLGPVVRYKGDGFWRNVNPYVSVAASGVSGAASDVNLAPVYGKGGASSIHGTGFNVRFGAQYAVKRFGITIEYRQESYKAKIDHFRSFVRGLNLTKASSYLLLGACLRL